MKTPISVLRELVALKNLHDAIEAIEAEGTQNFVDGKALPFAKDDYAARKARAWQVAARVVAAHPVQERGASPDAFDEWVQGAIDIALTFGNRMNQGRIQHADAALEELRAYLGKVREV
jgi:hypothetical protein